MAKISNRVIRSRNASSFRAPPFIACCLTLICTAVAMRPGMACLAKQFQKRPIPLKKPLDYFDYDQLRSFKRQPIPPVQQVYLPDAGTKDAFYAYFTPKNGAFKNQSVFLLVTYYSDPQDKVPHTPEVCYRQGATTIDQVANVTIDTPELGGQSPRTDVRLVLLHQPKGYGAILYSFYVSGQFCHSREQVRWRMYRPGDRYVYFSKIEAIAPLPASGDINNAVECCKRLLREALPVLIQEHFPEDAQLK